MINVNSLVCEIQDDFSDEDNMVTYRVGKEAFDVDYSTDQSIKFKCGIMIEYDILFII
jgi:hypothetical protein